METLTLTLTVASEDIMGCLVHFIFCCIQTMFRETLDINLYLRLFVRKDVKALYPSDRQSVNIVEHQSRDVFFFYYRDLVALPLLIGL